MVRHAHVHNPQDILYGRLPRFGLSEEGRNQAETLARFLSTREVAAIYTSPLLRARQTARAIGRYHPGVSVHTSTALLEVKTGYQGSPNTILKPGFSFFEPLKGPGDETMSDVWTRMRRFLERASRRHAGERIIAVSHADPITIMRVGLLDQPLTVENLHGAVYPGRASVNQVILIPGQPLRLAYFNAALESIA